MKTLTISADKCCLALLAIAILAPIIGVSVALSGSGRDGNGNPSTVDVIFISPNNTSNERWNSIQQEVTHALSGPRYNVVWIDTDYNATLQALSIHRHCADDSVIVSPVPFKYGTKEFAEVQRAVRDCGNAGGWLQAVYV